MGQRHCDVEGRDREAASPCPRTPEARTRNRVRPPNPYMASFVNRRTPNRGRKLLLPRRQNRTAVDRLAYGCMGLSDDGVSVSLHQTLRISARARLPVEGDFRPTAAWI